MVRQAAAVEEQTGLLVTGKCVPGKADDHVTGAESGQDHQLDGQRQITGYRVQIMVETTAEVIEEMRLYLGNRQWGPTLTSGSESGNHPLTLIN